MKLVQPIKDIRKIDELKSAVAANPRNYLLIIFGLNSGLRVGDLLKLKVSEVRGKSHVTIQESKTGKAKYFKLNAVLKSVIEHYVKDLDDNDFLFKSRQGGNKPISRFMAYKIVKDAAQRVGLEDIGTHSLRKSMAFQIYERTKDIGLIMSLLNHSSARVSLRYIGISQQVLDDAIENNCL